MSYAVFIAVAIVLATVLAFWALAGLQYEVPDEERTYLDPLPFFLRVIWPLIRFLSAYLSPLIPPPLMERLHKMVNRAGASYMLSTEDFAAIIMISGVFGALLIGFVTSGVSAGLTYLMTLMGALLGFGYPVLWLRKRYTRRIKQIQKELPIYIDFIVLGVEAGMNFTNALAQTVSKGPAGPMRQEFYMVMRGMRAGLSRVDALRRMDNRLENSDITSFVSAIIQAEQVGASVGRVLRLQAEQRRNERFQRAEKLAMEAPVKLILPLVMFIFPTTFIVLAFPIVTMVRNQGLM